MPFCAAWRPRKMFPPPMTIAVCTRRSWIVRISWASRSRTAGSMPYPCSPARASPESFSRMRLKRGSASLTDLEPHEAPDGDLLAGLGAHLGDEVGDPKLAVRVPDVSLVDQALVLVELGELALDDLLEHLGRLLLVGHLLPVDLALALDDIRRHLVPRHPLGVGRRHLHRQAFDQILELLGARDEVRLAVHLDEDAQLGARMDVRADDPVPRLPVGALRSCGEALLAEEIDRLLH